MAIDTKAKRSSVQAYTLGLIRPPPDGVIGSSDRATVAWYYSGLSYTPPPADTYPPYWVGYFTLLYGYFWMRD